MLYLGTVHTVNYHGVAELPVKLYNDTMDLTTSLGALKLKQMVLWDAVTINE